MPDHERPSRLPHSASFIVWACEALTPVEKIVWYHDWALDQGGLDGAYMSNASMGQRLALAPRTVEQARNRLKLLGLHEPLRRRDARNLGWVATLPPECRPMTNRTAGEEAVRLAGVLSAHVRARDAWRSNQRILDAPAGAVSMQPSAQAPREVEGGKGGALHHRSTSEAQLPPVVTERMAEGGVAGIPARRVEERANAEIVGDILKRMAR